MATATVALHIRDPHVHGAWGYCPSYFVFGVYCPGCGGLRAVNDLSNGDIAAAFHSNALFVTTLPLMLAVYIWWVLLRWSGTGALLPERAHKPMVWTGTALAVCFALVRNLPIGHALAP